MITEGRAVALLDEVNPVPDLESYEVAEAEVAAYLATLGQRSNEMTQLDTDKKESTEEKRPMMPWLVAAATAVILGAAIVLVTQSTEEAPPAAQLTQSTIAEAVPTTVAPPQPFTVEEALAVMDAYFAAFKISDVDAVRGLYASDATIPGGMEGGFFEEWELDSVWDVAQGAVKTVEECVADQSGGARIEVRCEYTDHQYIARAVGAPPVPWIMTVRFDQDGKIRSLFQDFGNPNYKVVNTPFDSWMQANHPDDFDKVDCCAGDTVEESVARGELRSAYADLWVAYLEAKGCTYQDAGC